MKKIILLMVLIMLTCACSIKGDNLDGSTIYVTNYPIKYLVETLYKNHATIESIYPDDADTTTYELTDKQIKQYSKGDIFVYNGLTKEKELAKNFINHNRNLLIMDVSYGLAIENSTEELWLSPNNYLMLAKNIRDNFKEYLSNKYIIEEVEKNYSSLAEIISLMDADLRSVNKQAISKGKSTIVVTSNAYKYLENYGFTIVDLSSDAYSTDSAQKNIKNNFKNNKYLALISDENEKNDLVADLINNYNAKNINLSKMTLGISEDDYIATMQEFIDNLQNLVN